MKDKLLNVVIKGKNMVNGVFSKGQNLTVKTDSGEGYVDTLVKVIIAIVIGGLLLLFFKDTFTNIILPTVTTRLQEMFN